MIPDRCLFLLNSKVALSRSKSINFVHQQHSTAVQLVLLLEAGYNYSTHRPGISNLWLLYFEIVSVKKVRKFVCIDLVAC